MKLLPGLLALLMVAGCAAPVKRDDGSKVPKESFTCPEGKKFSVSLHDNVAYLYLGLSRKQLKRQPMQDGMIIFSDGVHTLSYKTRVPRLSLEGQDWGDCQALAAP